MKQQTVGEFVFKDLHQEDIEDIKHELHMAQEPLLKLQSLAKEKKLDFLSIAIDAMLNMVDNLAYPESYLDWQQRSKELLDLTKAMIP